MNELLGTIISKCPQCVEELNVKLNPSKLLETEYWPLAVEQHLIVDESNPEEVEKRAKSILWSFVRDKLTGKRVLDFGTGNSACWKYADGSVLSLGYDIDHNSDAIHDWSVILDNRPYDIIIMFDVLDHLVDNNGNLMPEGQIIELLTYLREILSIDGKLFLRCHPWVSRHGTHAYRKKNKAFIHFLTSEFDTEPTHKIVTPNWTYDNLVQRAGFRVISKIPSIQQIEAVFTCFESWAHHFQNGYRPDIMSYNFIDYILGR